MKILIVDDDEDRAEGLAIYLVKNLNIHMSSVTKARSVDEAKGLLREAYYEALVMDVMLPKRLGEPADSCHGFALLSQVSRGRFLQKPDKIIGITANEAELNSYREKFDEYCAVVIAASNSSDKWRKAIQHAIEYSAASRASRRGPAQAIAVFTVHGIRTYGDWQDRLERLVRAEVEDVQFHTYKYGYFSTLAFLLPFQRNREVRKLEGRVSQLLGDLAGKRIIVFCHSFGTYLAAMAIDRTLRNVSNADLCLVCAGSVLPENFNWSFARAMPGVKVINDCGSKDNILLLAKCFALGMGMGGRTGFHGFNDDRFHNRWFRGGHSHYFDGDDFMARYWVPLIADSNSSTIVDERVAPTTLSSLGNSVVNLIGIIKPGAYVMGLLIACLVVVLLF